MYVRKKNLYLWNSFFQNKVPNPISQNKKTMFFIFQWPQAAKINSYENFHWSIKKTFN